MAGVQEFRDLISGIQGHIDAIAQDILDIKNSLPSAGGLSAVETAEVKASLQTVLDRVTALDLENPAPTAGTVEVNTINQKGADNGIGPVGTVIANDDPNLALFKANGLVDTTFVPKP